MYWDVNVLVGAVLNSRLLWIMPDFDAVVASSWLLLLYDWTLPKRVCALNSVHQNVNKYVMGYWHSFSGSDSREI